MEVIYHSQQNKNIIPPWGADETKADIEAEKGAQPCDNLSSSVGLTSRSGRGNLLDGGTSATMELTVKVIVRPNAPAR